MQISSLPLITPALEYLMASTELYWHSSLVHIPCFPPTPTPTYTKYLNSYQKNKRPDFKRGQICDLGVQMRFVEVPCYIQVLQNTQNHPILPEIRVLRDIYLRWQHKEASYIAHITICDMVICWKWEIRMSFKDTWRSGWYVPKGEAGQNLCCTFKTIKEDRRLSVGLTDVCDFGR